MKKCLQLFLTFFKIGAITFGGGYAMLNIIQKEVCDKRGWASEEEILECYTISQCTPGVIAVNTATGIGYKQKGLLGAAFATLGVVTPSLIIISIIAGLLKNYADNPYVIHAMNGIRVVVCVFIFNAVQKFWKSGVKDNIGYIIFLLAFCLCALFSLSSAIIVLIAGVIGVSVKVYLEKKGGKADNA